MEKENKLKQEPCIKCGAIDQFILSIDGSKKNCLNCRKILRDQCYDLLASEKVDEAKMLIENSEESDSWKNQMIFYTIPDFLRFKKKELEDKLEKEKEKKIEIILNKVDYFLSKKNFLKADQFILEEKFDKSLKNEILKRYNTKKFNFFRQDLNNLGITLENKKGWFPDEKVKVLSATNKNILVQARAGSGKTETIALKVRQLIKFYGVKPDEILVLAFNSKAAEEFRNRINEYCDAEIATKANTLTFHALAKRIADKKDLLVDKRTKERSVNEYNRHGRDGQLQIDFVRKCFNKVEEEDRSSIEKLFYLFLKTASEKIKGAFRNDNEYYLYLRNQKYTTIAGEFVKSTGEKYIADFLFEHKISKNGKRLEYVYEHNIKKLLNTKYPYNPDFSLFYVEDKRKEQLQIVIEYFGFTKKSPGYPGFFETEGESQKYLNRSDEKRKLFLDRNINFIEMSQDDFEHIKTKPFLYDEQTRDQFEKIIRQRLSEKGLYISSRLSANEVLEKIPKVERRKKKLVKQITQFINKAQKMSYTPEKIREIAWQKKTGNLSKQNEYFIEMACRVYDKYQLQLEKEDKIDFDGLLVNAIKKVKGEGKNSKIVYCNEKKEVGSIKHILIDEYQDFSELFYKLIDEIRKVNPEISFFCVGDDWQAINGFAGSDLKYFNNFESEYFKGGCRVNLLTNYRSNKVIVWRSNRLMVGLGPAGEPKNDKPDGVVCIFKLLQVELRKNQNYIHGYNEDKKYREETHSLLGRQTTNKSIPLDLARYLKTVESIICNEADTNKEFCLLFRGNKLLGLPISKFANKIREWCPKKQTNIIYSTVHSFKGKQSDIVIVIGANRGNFPKFHPDNELMEIFGITVDKIKDEELRLFYVAMTRAKEKLYLIYDEKVGMSDFISMNNSIEK
ncbi:MAG: UvrD-helicase domain-containing protein [bacterium]